MSRELRAGKYNTVHYCTTPLRGLLVCPRCSPGSRSRRYRYSAKTIVIVAQSNNMNFLAGLRYDFYRVNSPQTREVAKSQMRASQRSVSLKSRQIRGKRTAVRPRPSVFTSLRRTGPTCELFREDQFFSRVHSGFADICCSANQHGMTVSGLPTTCALPRSTKSFHLILAGASYCTRI